ncbi:hypothetical protein VM1G_00657 [Cytospora mali]|uniref:Uncharacterized protein n=1 Tax=Cytospora mali TaxID=578113 RepID=A0A194VKH2_CYTMA|nr:hypothetical protein VM1G_00657 [Valsa mali]
MDGSSNAWTEEDWAFMSSDSSVTPSWENIPGVYPEETPDDTYNFNGISAVELLAADMSVSGSLEQPSQHMWPTAPDLSQQYGPYAFPDTNIYPGSIGSHPQDDWSISSGLPTHDPLFPMGGISPQPMPTNLSNPFGQVIPTFPQQFADQESGQNISSVDSNFLSDGRIGNPYGVAIETSSSSNSPGSRPSLERGGQPTPNSSVGPEQDENVHHNLQVPAKQRRTRARKA